MPIEQGESMTEDLNDPPTPTASHFPPPVEEMTLPQTQMEEEPAARGPEANQSETMQLEQEKETGHLQAAQHTHVIRNVDEIFHTIEELMTKLRHLKVSFVEKPATKKATGASCYSVCVNWQLHTPDHVQCVVIRPE